MDCMQYGVYPVRLDEAEKILDLVDALENTGDMRELIQKYNECFVR